MAFVDMADMTKDMFDSDHLIKNRGSLPVFEKPGSDIDMSSVSKKAFLKYYLYVYTDSEIGKSAVQALNENPVLRKTTAVQDIKRLAEMPPWLTKAPTIAFMDGEGLLHTISGRKYFEFVADVRGNGQEFVPRPIGARDFNVRKWMPQNNGLSSAIAVADDGELDFSDAKTTKRDLLKFRESRRTKAQQLKDELRAGHFVERASNLESYLEPTKIEIRK